LNLTQITTQIGSMQPETDNLPFAPLPKVKADKGEVPCSAKLVFDLNKKRLYFKFHSDSRTERELYYFGNNKAASAQIFLVRALKDVKYLIGTVLSDLFLELRKLNMQDSELGRVLQQLQEAELYIQASKTKEGFLATDKWYDPQGEQFLYNKEKGVFQAAGRDVSVEKMIRDAEEINPRDRIVVVVPAVLFPDGSELLLNEHPDYHALVRKSLKLDAEEDPEANEQELRTCHLCHREMPQVASDKYLAKLSRTGLNKIFTTTTVNSARDIQKSGYDDAYAVCQQCYGKLSRGERYIANNLSGRIAGEKVFILPEGLLTPFETYKYFPNIKDAVDFVFQAKDAEDWYKKAISEAEYQIFTNGYTINLVFHRTDGNSINVIETLEDVPPLRLVEIMKRFGVWKNRMREQNKWGMTLGRVYRIIPVRSTRKKEQLDIQRVLDIYKALLLKQLFSPRQLFQYAMESIDEGLSQIQRQKREVFLNLPYYPKGSSDLYLRDMVMNHLALMQVMQESGVLVQPIFGKDVKVVEQTFKNERVQESIRRMEDFIEEQGFNTEAKGVFYLGVLLHRVALDQYIKGHKSKPILKKINYQGMKTRDIQRLSLDLAEKLLQYRRMNAFTDALMNRYHAYYDPVVAGAATTLDELRNVFFLLAGYAYMVGKKAPDASKAEEKIQQSLMSEDESNQQEEN